MTPKLFGAVAALIVALQAATFKFVLDLDDTRADIQALKVQVARIETTIALKLSAQDLQAAPIAPASYAAPAGKKALP